MYIHMQICKAECIIQQRQSISQELKAEQTGLKRIPMQPHSKAEESSVGRVTTGATATSAQAVQELVVAQVPQTD